MDCQYCKSKCQKAGKQKNGSQKLLCKGCKKYQQKVYIYRACYGRTDGTIQSLVCESVGVRGISRVLKKTTGTVLRRIRLIAAAIGKPAVRSAGQSFEVDELWTYIGQKEHEYWVAYALDRKTREVIDFVVGKRTKSTLKLLIDRLLGCQPKRVYTDKLTFYSKLIPGYLHRRGAYCINHIERKNLSIRTHLKRLSRRTICFSRSMVML